MEREFDRLIGVEAAQGIALYPLSCWNQPNKSFPKINRLLADVVERWLPARLALIPLSSSRPEGATGNVVERWRILNNATGIGK